MACVQLFSRMADNKHDMIHESRIQKTFREKLASYQVLLSSQCGEVILALDRVTLRRRLSDWRMKICALH